MSGKTEVDLGFGPVRLVADDYYQERVRLAVEGQREQVELYFPDQEDPDSLAEGVSYGFRRYGTMANSETWSQLMPMLRTAGLIAVLWDEAMAPQVEVAREAQRRAEEERERAQAERERVINERKDRLMMEFVGDQVRIRERGIKSMALATVEVVAEEKYDYDTREHVATGEYLVQFAWKNPADRYNRTNRLAKIQRLDVKRGSRWETIWDDGSEDLPEYQRGSGIPKVVMYDAG